MTQFDIAYDINDINFRVNTRINSGLLDQLYDACRKGIAMNRPVCCLGESSGARYIATTRSYDIRHVSLLTVPCRPARVVVTACCVYDDESAR